MTGSTYSVRTAVSQTYLRFREAKCSDGRVRRLTNSEYTTNALSAGYNEANGVWSIGLHCGLSPDSNGPSLETLHGFHGHGGLYQWTRVAMGLKRPGPYFQRSMSNTYLVGLVYQICELYIDDVLIHGRDIEQTYGRYSRDSVNSISLSTQRKQSPGLPRWNT